MRADISSFLSCQDDQDVSIALSSLYSARSKNYSDTELGLRLSGSPTHLGSQSGKLTRSEDVSVVIMWAPV